MLLSFIRFIISFFLDNFISFRFYFASICASTYFSRCSIFSALFNSRSLTTFYALRAILSIASFSVVFRLSAITLEMILVAFLFTKLFSLSYFSITFGSIISSGISSNFSSFERSYSLGSSVTLVCSRSYSITVGYIFRALY